MRSLKPALPALWLAGTAVVGSQAVGATAEGSSGFLLLLFALAARGSQGLARWAAAHPGVFGLSLLFWLLAGVSVLASPASRAGWWGWCAVPLFAHAFFGIARAVDEGREERVVVQGWLAGATLLVSWTALGYWVAGVGPRPALPLGHHNLLAAWLVFALPLGVAGGFEGRRGGPLLASLALGLGGSALLLTRSLSGFVGMGVSLLWALPCLSPAVRRLLLGTGMLGAGLWLERLSGILEGRDPSAVARWQYAGAALSGARERPWLGWGPGSTPWLLAEWLEPLPGWNPPGEGVGEAHALGVQLLFELGYPLGVAALGLGLLLPIVLSSRAGEPDARRPVRLATAGLLGGWATLLFGAAPLAVAAIPAVWVGAAGVAYGLAGVPLSADRPVLRKRILLASRGVLGLLAVALSGPELAKWSYERARRAGDGEAAAVALERAHRLDPAFPLYRARRAWLEADPSLRLPESLRAAEEARGVAFLWLKAAADAWAAGDLEACGRAARRALALDPLGGVAPWILFRASGETDLDCAARALALEPRLAAATVWAELPSTRRREVLSLLEAWPGLPPDFARELDRRLSASVLRGDRVDLVVELDGTPAVSPSVHLFRRSPWRTELVRVRLDRNALQRLDGLGSAAARGVSPRSFPKASCRPEGDRSESFNSPSGK